jgi:hypothetical protein
MGSGNVSKHRLTYSKKASRDEFPRKPPPRLLLDRPDWRRTGARELAPKGIKAVDFSNREEFELHVHKCFGKIFDNLMKVDALVKDGAEKEEAEGKHGIMNELRDYVEDVILHCHLAWQYHRLSRMVPGPVTTWDKVESEKGETESGSMEKTETRA